MNIFRDLFRVKVLMLPASAVFPPLSFTHVSEDVLSQLILLSHANQPG
jgi:hypothetical protein